MANIILENLSDDLIQKIEQLAQQHHQSVSEEIISILKQAVEKPSTPLKFVISPETDPTWAQRCQATPKILAEIEKRRRQRKSSECLDSTELIREDRER